MKKRGQLAIITIIILVLVVGIGIGYFVLRPRSTPSNPQPNQTLPEVPWSMYTMHVEQIDWYDECFVDIVELAEEYNTPLTMLLWPQIAEHILADEDRLAQFRGWLEEGHEMGIHTQGCGMGIQGEEGAYLNEGDAETYEELAGDYELKTCCSLLLTEEPDLKEGFIPCSDWLPESIIYQGMGRYDGRTSMSMKYKVLGKTLYDLHIKAGYTQPLSIKKGQYESLNPDEIYDFNTHAECDLEKMEQWLQYLSEKDPEGKKRKTQTWIMENVIIPNNQYIDLGEVVNLEEKRYYRFDELLNLEDPQISKCAQLITCPTADHVITEGPTDIFNFGRCLMTDTYCAVDEQCSTNPTRKDPYYEPTRCTLKNINDLEDYKSASETCPGIPMCSSEALKGIGSGDTEGHSEGKVDEVASEVSTENICGDGVCSIKEYEKGDCPGDCN